MKTIVATADLFLDKRRERKYETFPVKLKITYNRQRKYYNTSLFASEENWCKLNSKRTAQSFVDTKTKLLSVKVRAQNCIDNLVEFSFPHFENVFFPKRINRYIVQASYEEYIDMLKEQERFGSVGLYKTSLSALLKYQARLKFNQIAPMFLDMFEKFQLNKGLYISTVGIYLRPLRRIVNIEIANQNFPENKYPFSKGKYTIPIGKRSKRHCQEM